jgi:hypothetical protein
MGLQLGESSRIKRVVITHDYNNRSTSFTTPSGCTQLITVIEATNFRGNRTVPPLFITSGKIFTESLLPIEISILPSKFYLTRTATAFTNQEITREWLKRCFLSYTKVNSQWRMLILDGHKSHISTDFFDLCLANNLFPLFLPPHATHLLQPLDLVNFGVIKQRFHTLLYNRTLEGNLSVNFSVFFALYFQSREEGLSQRNCQAAFREAGLIPLNRGKCLQNLVLRPRTPPQQILSQNPANPALSPLKIRGNDVKEEIVRLFHEGTESETRIYALSVAKLIDSPQAKLQVAKSMHQRDENLLKDARKARASTRRVAMSPNSLFLSRRAIARHRGEIESSPPSSPPEPRSKPPRVKYSLLPSLQEGMDS